MRIKSLKLSQYRQYRDCELNFSAPLRGKTDLNIFVGLNGAGKTNIANAICWCLWDVEPDLALEGKNLGKGKLNDRTRARLKELGKPTGDVTVELKITLDQHGTEELIVTRTCECAVESGLEHQSKLVVTRMRKEPGNVRVVDPPIYGEEAQQEIEACLPYDISSYLVFDGEQLTGYFKSERAAKVKTAMLALSGVAKLNIALEHHSKQIREIDKGVSGQSGEMTEWTRKKEIAEADLKKNDDAIVKYESQARQLRASIDELKDFIGSHRDVPDLLKRKDRLEQEIKQIKSEFSRIKNKKCELIRTYYPLMAVFPAAVKIKAFIGTKREKEELPPPLKREFFEEILKLGKCSVCGEVLSAKAKKEIEKQLKLYDKKIVAKDTSEQLTSLLEPQIISLIERVKFYLDQRDQILREEANLFKREAEKESDLLLVNDRLSKVNDTAAYQNAIQKCEIQSSTYEQVVEQLGACKGRRGALRTALEQTENNYNKAYERSVENETLLNKRKLLLKSQSIISKTKDRLIDDIRRSIEETVNTFWQVLTWKSNEDIGKVFVDEEFRIDLRDNGSPALGTLSAAERALLALSVTLALHNKAGVNFPLVIDTPVANMSLEHRKNFATVLKSIASMKQIIMLFTDTEYVADIPKVFGRDVNTERTLEFKNGVTNVK